MSIWKELDESNDDYKVTAARKSHIVLIKKNDNFLGEI